MNMLDECKIGDTQCFAYYTGNDYAIQVRDGLRAKTVFHCQTVWSILRWAEGNGYELIDFKKWKSLEGAA